MSKSKPAAPKKRKLFLVVRHAIAGGRVYGCYPIYGAYDGERREVPVRAFARQSDAEAYARELDDEVRADFPLPLLAEVLARTHEQAVSEWLPGFLAEHDMPPIAFGRRPYGVELREWWARNAADLSAEQRAALWEPFRGLTFHDVKQIEVVG